MSGEKEVKQSGLVTGFDGVAGVEVWRDTWFKCSERGVADDREMVVRLCE